MALPQTPNSNGIDYIDDEDFIAFEIPWDSAGERLDKILASTLTDYSRSRLQTWVEAGAVTVDGEVRKARYLLKGGESVRVFPQEMPEQHAFAAENLPLEVQVVDETLIVINKPAGLVVHPAAGNWSGTLLNGLLFRFPELKQLPRAGIVHRLDKDTSGLMVVARTAITQTALVRQLQAHLVNRCYLALVWGVAPTMGKIASSIARDTRDRLRMAVVGKDQGKTALTHFRRLAQGSFMGKAVSLLECRLETGRTHQIRVHLESIGLPLLGDPIYRKQMPSVAKELPFHRQALHAYALGLQHPQVDQLCNWFASPPTDFLELLSLVQIDTSALPPKPPFGPDIGSAMRTN